MTARIVFPHPIDPPRRPRRVPGWLWCAAITASIAVAIAALISAPWWVAGTICVVYLAGAAPRAFREAVYGRCQTCSVPLGHHPGPCRPFGHQEGA